MKLNSIKGILFLIEFTNYHITNIYIYLNKYDTLDEMQKELNINTKIIEDYLNKSELIYQKTIFNNIKMVKFDEEDYPSSLNILNNKPPLLFYKGCLPLKKNLVAIIGTRENTDYGRKLTEKITKLVYENNYGIVSGLALGIDSIAHKKSLELGAYTMAILPCSLDTIYPVTNYELANEILLAGGGLLSELPIGTSLGKARFVQRNRLQSALSDIVIPVELKSNSGTVHTIKFALNQNKKVCFLKPPINDLEYNIFYKECGLEKLVNDLIKKYTTVYNIGNKNELITILQKKVGDTIKNTNQQTLFDFDN